MGKDKPKLAIVGYGRMGKEIESLARSKGFIISNIFDLDNQINPSESYDFDVALEFTSPDSVVSNIEKLAKLKKNIVVGTTGWYSELDTVKFIVERNEIGLVYSRNFLVGMNVLFKIIPELIKLLNEFIDFDIAVEEIHHRHKKDAPSGTALRIAELIVQNSSRKKIISTNPMDVLQKPEILNVSCTRVGESFGEHSIIFDSPFETIEINHTIKSRQGIAYGALIASKFIWGKKGLFEFTI